MSTWYWNLVEMAMDLLLDETADTTFDYCDPFKTAEREEEEVQINTCVTIEEWVEVGGRAPILY